MSDLISRESLLNKINAYVVGSQDKEFICKLIKEMSSVENKGEWIYDKTIYNWRCSRCNQTPPPTGYVGKADFMATYFKFCNYCGAKMKGDN